MEVPQVGAERNNMETKTNLEPVKLVVYDGRLATPYQSATESARQWVEPNEPILLYSSEWEDPAFPRWPLQEEPGQPWQAKRDLAGALFDAVEMGFLPDVRFVLLPDGSPFHFDLVLSETEQDAKAFRAYLRS